MKKIQRLFAICLTAMLCAVLGVFAACGDKEDSSSSSSSPATQPNAYVICVLNADGTPAKDIKVQLCLNVENGLCLPQQTTNESGKVEIPTADGKPGEYKIQLIKGMDYQTFQTIYYEFTGDKLTNATAFSTHTVTLGANAE